MEDEKKEDDVVTGMSNKHTDPKTGEVKNYKINYSQKLQKETKQNLD